MRRASPVEAMAAAGPKDDPMDLGPFLKEYVLNNPFISTPPPPRPLPVVTIKSRPLVVPSPPSLVSRNNCSPVLPVQSVTHVPVLAVKALPIVAPPVVQQVAPLVHASSHTGPMNLSPRGDPPVLAKTEEEEELEEEREERIQIGGVVDTPKAHIGSNKNFAAMLREMKLPHKHTKVKKWLLANYRHIGNSPEWLSSDDLIDHANTLFADLKSSVLSRIMKVTFPNCHKVINKYGYFYIGLVRRPEAQHYNDELLRMASKAVVEGRFNGDNAAKIHGVSSQLINRMVAWYDTINDPIPDVKPGQDSDPDWVMSDTGSDETEEETSVEPQPRANLKWKLRQRARSRLLTKIKQSARKDKPSDGPWEPQGRMRPYNTRSPRMQLRKQLKDELEDGDSQEVTVKCENESDDDDDDDDEFRMEIDGTGSAGSDVTATTGSPLPVISAIGSLEVRVKEEPVDTGYEEYERNNNISQDSKNDDKKDSSNVDPPTKESFNTLRTLLKEKANVATQGKGRGSPEGGSTKSAPHSHESSTVPAAGSTGGRPQSLNSVVDLLTMKQKLQRFEEELREKETQNIELEKRLSEAHSEIVDLKKNVSSQETQLMDLASEFFELSNRFMKVTHKFKQALSDAKLGQDKS